MLINCPECNKEISDKAETCPNCGYKLPKPDPLFQGEYCPKCLDCGIKTTIELCPYCRTKYKNSIIGTLDEVNAFVDNHPELKRSPEFSYDAYNKRINYVPYEYPTSNVAKCPTCGSTDLSKVSSISKVGSVLMFGLLSQKVKKTWHCNNCKYEW